ncbi:glycosyltransferase [Kineosporia babensis]|uniref:Glycosyltransferase n=1 Tax=Kineosporia babensis TaxID=499548 RepID=A0A9X1N9K9_9ACTN|nr:glycosyltransferase [Kineosporia babensis]MCD5310100.1 glycosyltransferase [Kineosporia babensis]
MKPQAFTIVIPAKDEAGLVGDCLDSVLAATAATRRPVAVVLVAHHCSDSTENVARQILSRTRGLTEGMVLRLNDGNVATARSAGAMAGLYLLAAYGIPFEETLLLSTDADSRVPPDWIEGYRPYFGSGSAAVAGMVRVNGWESNHAYQKIVHAGLRSDGHDHVYAANLAVRADAYLDVGGWPEQVPGEDSALLAALRTKGWPVASAPEVVVNTSGRTAPRADGGLGSLLSRLARDERQNALIIPRQVLRSRS